MAAGRLTASLEPPPRGTRHLGERFVPLRGLLVQQELAHRRLGEVWVPRLAFLLIAEPAERYAMQVGATWRWHPRRWMRAWTPGRLRLRLIPR